MYEQPRRSIWQKLAAFAKESSRVFHVTKKPDKVEFTTVLKVSALGAGVIGLIGFLVYLLWSIVSSSA